jgi:membrane protein
LAYYLAPNRERSRWRWTSAGALFGTDVWALISLGFSYCTSSFGSQGETYGAFAGVTIPHLLALFSGLSILVAGEINASFERQH